MISRKILPFMLLILFIGCTTEPTQQPKQVKQVSKPKPPNIILLSIDTLRADHLGMYGYNRAVSPTLDKLSRQGHVFCTVNSQSPLTAPAHMSMFTSLYPESHQVRNVSDGAPTRLSSQIPTLAEQMKNAGYGTIACTDGGNVNNALGFSKGFDMYGETGAEQFVSLVKVHPRQPWFSFLHTYWVHDPYIVPNPFYKFFDRDYSGGIKGNLEDYNTQANYFGVASFRTKFWDTVDFTKDRDREHLVNLYDSAIRMIDLSLRGLLNLLDEMEIKDNTILIITSDHGEEFFEHSRILHERLYSETLQVPLLFIDFRDQKPGRLIETPVQLVDIAPTLLDYLNLPPIPGAQGASLKAGLLGQSLEDRVHYSIASAPYNSRMTSKGPWKYIINPNRVPSNNDAWVLGLPRPSVPTEELYNLDQDPGETSNVTTDHPEILKEMQELTVKHSERMKTVSDQYTRETAEVDDNAMAMLEALGYVE